MFAPLRLLLMSPPWAERMNVTTAPKSATANMTSSREKPRRISEPVVFPVRSALVVGGENEVDRAGFDGHLARERADEQRQRLVVLFGVADAQLDGRALGQAPGPEVEIGAARRPGRVVVRDLHLPERDASLQGLAAFALLRLAESVRRDRVKAGLRDGRA